MNELKRYLSFSETLVTIKQFVRCSKCDAFLRVNRQSNPFIYVDTEHVCRPKKKEIANAAVK